MAKERLYIVSYDIACPKRWRGVFKTMHGYGNWLQLSVFQCRLTAMRHAELIADMDLLIDRGEDHVLIVDIGPAEAVEPKVTSIGKPYDAPKREAVVA